MHKQRFRPLVPSVLTVFNSVLILLDPVVLALLKRTGLVLYSAEGVSSCLEVFYVSIFLVIESCLVTR